MPPDFDDTTFEDDDGWGWIVPLSILGLLISLIALGVAVYTAGYTDATSKCFS